MKKSFIKYLIALLLFGSNGVVVHGVGLTSQEIVLLRSALGSVLLTAIFFLSGRRLTALSHRRDMLMVALSGVAMGADWLLLFEAYAQIGVGPSILINYCGPAIVIAISVLFFKEKVSGRKLIALCAAMVGVVLISGEATVTGTAPVGGLICAILSAFAYAAMVLFNRNARQVTGMENSMLQLLSACVTVVMYVAIKQGLNMDIPAENWPNILWLGLVNTGLGCYLYFSSIGALPVQTVAVCGYLEPLSAVLFSVILLDESMLPMQMVGAALIIGGAIFGELEKRKKRT